MANFKFHLFQLQKLDTHIHAICKKLEEIERSLTHDPLVQKTIENLRRSNESHLVIQSTLDDVETKIKTKRVKVEQSESVLYKGKILNPKELQDLQKEVVTINSQISLLEESQYELLIQLENSQKEIDINEQQYRNALQINEQNNKILVLQKNDLTSELNNLNNEKTLIISQVPSSFLSEYQELITKKSGHAVALVTEESCAVCGASLSPSECQQAKSPATLTHCPSCARILYAG